MSNEFNFRLWSHRASDWAADYLETLAERPVTPNAPPGAVFDKISDQAPETSESMDVIFNDFKRIIPQHMTHWQHPRFFAYFQANAAPPAQLAEQLACAFASQCMLWQTSPAATELEVKMVDWLRQAFGLPAHFKGSLQDTASSSTLSAVLVMREKALGFKGNQEGLFEQKKLRIYASSRTHSSIDKALWIAGIGQDNLVKIPTSAGPHYGIDVEALARAIAEDRAAGHIPAGIIINFGGTSIGAMDDIQAVCTLAQKEGLYTHLDAAWAGSAMICPELRHLWAGVEHVDSIVINPHKWLGVPMECALHLVKDVNALKQTLSIQPEYLKTYGLEEAQKTPSDFSPNSPSSFQMINFSDISIQLGRRFRALKVWFLLRFYGLENLRERIRNHIAWSHYLANYLSKEEDFDIVTEPILSLFTFRHIPPTLAGNAAALDSHTLKLVQNINADGRIYLTQTDHNGIKAIRFVAGQFDMREKDIHIASETIIEIARRSSP